MFNEDNEELGVLIPVLLHSFFFFQLSPIFLTPIVLIADIFESNILLIM